MGQAFEETSGGISRKVTAQPEPGPDDYIGEQMFHTRVYLAPSGVATLGAVVVSDLVIRPVGSIITIFGARSTGESLDKIGQDLIRASLKVKFL